MANKHRGTRRTSPPVIGSLIKTLQGKAVKRGGMTVPELVKDLVSKTGRKEQALTYTVRAQLSRLPKEKKIRIKKQREGQVVRYLAAA